MKKPVMVRQSWGGVIALAYAQEYSDEITGIVLSGSSPYPRDRKADIFNVIARTPVIGDLIVHTLYMPIGRHWIAPAIPEQNKDYFVPLNTVPESFYDTAIELGLRPSHLKASAEETSVIPASLAALVENLDKINLPVMIAAGDQDTHAIEQSSRLQQDLPASKVVVVEGADHYLWFSNPEIVTETIRQLCRAIAFSQTVNTETEQERQFPVIARETIHQRASRAMILTDRKRQDVLDLASTSIYKHKVQYFTQVETYIEHYNLSERQYSGNFDRLFAH